MNEWASELDRWTSVGRGRGARATSVGDRRVRRAAPRPAVFDAPSPTIELGHELFDDTKTPFRRPARSLYVTYIT